MATPATTTSQAPAVKRSVARVLIFSVLSPFYGLYWFFVTREAATKELGTQDNVGLQTAGLLVPILNIFIIYWLFRDIDKLDKKVGLPGFPALWFILGPIILAIIPFVNLVAGIVALVLYGLVISYFNQYWDKKTGNKAVEAKVSGGEIAIVVVGLVVSILFWVLIGTSVFFANKAVNEFDRNLKQQYNSTYNTSVSEDKSKVSAQEIYDKVKDGMTKRQVRDIAGREPDSKSESENSGVGDIDSVSYSSGGRFVTITFSDGVVSNKSIY